MGREAHLLLLEKAWLLVLARTSQMKDWEKGGETDGLENVSRDHGNPPFPLVQILPSAPPL